MLEREAPAVLRKVPGAEIRTHNPNAAPGLRALIGATYRAVRQGGPPPVPPEEIVEAAELIERIHTASRT